MSDQDRAIRKLIEDITPDVLGVLRSQLFFEKLDDRFSPQDVATRPALCAHSFANTIEILQNEKIGAEEIADVLAVLQAIGGCCDCEILYNVAEESRLKAQYWQTRYAESQSQKSDSPSTAN